MLAYKMKQPCEIKRLWQEWYEGTNNQPSIVYLEEHCPQWRKKRGDKKSQDKNFRRKRALFNSINIYLNEFKDIESEEALLKRRELLFSKLQAHMRKKSNTNQRRLFSSIRKLADLVGQNSNFISEFACDFQ